MKLAPQDVQLFYRLYRSLLAHTNRKLKLIPGGQTQEEAMRFSLEEILKVREPLWENPDFIQSFVDENPFGLAAEELEIVRSWEHFVKGKFFLVGYLKKHAVFFEQDQQIAYGVLALSDDFEDLLGPHLPVLVEAVLLPFKEKIIYDSLMSPYGITFGRGASRSITDSYQQAKAKHGIVTSLPFSAEPQEQSDEDLLRFYLKNQKNRDQYWEDIWILIRKKPALRLLYHREMGKIHARAYKKRLQEIGIENGWFAILEGLIVAGGLTEQETEQAASKIVPPEKRAWLYIFRLGK